MAALKCNKCNIYKNISDMSMTKGTYRGYCKPCWNLLTKGYKTKSKNVIASPPTTPVVIIPQSYIQPLQPITSISQPASSQSYDLDMILSEMRQHAANAERLAQENAALTLRINEMNNVIENLRHENDTLLGRVVSIETTIETYPEVVDGKFSSDDIEYPPDDIYGMELTPLNVFDRVISVENASRSYQTNVNRSIEGMSREIVRIDEQFSTISVLQATVDALQTTYFGWFNRNNHSAPISTPISTPTNMSIIPTTPTNISSIPSITSTPTNIPSIPSISSTPTNIPSIPSIQYNKK